MLRMHFAHVYVGDEDRAIEFYTKTLGFELLMDNPTPFGGRFVMFAPPGGGAKLVVSKPIPGRDGKPGGYMNIAWEAEDLQALYEDWKAKGVTFDQVPTRQPWGGFEARFADPDGNIYMLQQMAR